jgi:intracellular multiplication protein IcmD
MKGEYEMKFKYTQVMKKTIKAASILLVCFFSQQVLADNETLGTMADLITSSFTSVTKLITAVSYLAGIAFAIGAILKFKQHKDQPGQIPIGQPIGLTVIAGALVFLPSVIYTLGYTAFGAPETAGPTGTIIETQ